VELANKVLRDLDELDKLEESYDVRRTNGYYEVRKRDKLADSMKEKLLAVQKNEISHELRQKIHTWAKTIAAL
jgi:hypothetical protein